LPAAACPLMHLMHSHHHGDHGSNPQAPGSTPNDKE
ncbi:MAG: DUF2933 domain-containing protein, partial [Polaromonas sp.]|nr:DUF2933 domain-containing protein [Polaromonas sp.]